MGSRWRPLAAIWIGLGLAVMLAFSAAAHDVEPSGGPSDLPASAVAACSDGLANGHTCMNMDLLARVTPLEAGGARANDLWGWTDPETGVEYALLGLNDGTAFIDLSDPTQPVVTGFLPTRSRASTWRDIKVYADHAYIVSEARGHGMQVFDLTRLRAVTAPPQTFQADALYFTLTAHNIAINEETGFGYIVGANACQGGLHMVDLSIPESPTFVGCFSGDGYTHDAQCVVYRGPDADWYGREICFASNEDTVTIVDVTDKSQPALIARAPYFGSEYTHQGWLTEDHAFFLLDDELDETRNGTNTRTFVWDVRDLDAPVVAGFHEAGGPSADHNQYVRGDHVFQANYRSGVRILRLGALDEAELREIAFFDTVPEDDLPLFSGAWSVYPFFESGVLIASDVYNGLFVLQPDLDAIGECEDGIDNDGDGRRDHPQDSACVSYEDPSEALRVDVRAHVDPFSEGEPIVLPRAAGHGSPLWVEIHGSGTVDVREIDRRSLRFGEASPLLLGERPRDRGFDHRRFPDLDGDGHPDLLVAFRVDEVPLVPGEQTVCMRGEIAGDPFLDCDEVEAVSPPPLPESAWRRLFLWLRAWAERNAGAAR